MTNEVERVLSTIKADLRDSGTGREDDRLTFPRVLPGRLFKLRAQGTDR